MKHVKLFEQFINEGKKEDQLAEEILADLMNEFEPHELQQMTLEDALDTVVQYNNVPDRLQDKVAKALVQAAHNFDYDEFFEAKVSEGKELSHEEYRKYFPILGYKGAGLEFNFNGQTVGGYVVPKVGDELEGIITTIEKLSKKKLTAVPYNQETGQFASGVGNDTWMKSGKVVAYLQVIKK